MLRAKHIMTEPHALLTKLIPTKEKYSRNTYTHKKDIATGLIESLTGKAILDLPIVYNVPKLDTEVIKEVKSIDKDIISIAATSKFKPKDMPIDVARDLINHINASGGVPIILGRGEVQREFVQELKNAGCSEFWDLTDKTTIPELANILKLSKALVSVDTGTMHLGNAVNTPTTAVFYSSGEEMWAPQPGLYKSTVLSGKPTGEEIFQALEQV